MAVAGQRTSGLLAALLTAATGQQQQRLHTNNNSTYLLLDSPPAISNVASYLVSSPQQRLIVAQQQQDEDYSLVQLQQQQVPGALGNDSTWTLLMGALLHSADDEQPRDWQRLHYNWPIVLLASVLILLMLTTAIGNLFVIVAILVERNLRTIGNYLVLSLAIADLLVALLVMPLAGIYQILERWTLGVLLCDIWTSADVFCCTGKSHDCVARIARRAKPNKRCTKPYIASILHLLAIALDRYWAVTRVDYIRCQRNERRILAMISLVWLAASVISLAPVFGWKDAQFEWRITHQQECLLSQDIGYQIFATCTTFYFPLTLTLIFYWKIYQVSVYIYSTRPRASFD